MNVYPRIWTGLISAVLATGWVNAQTVNIDAIAGARTLLSGTGADVRVEAPALNQLYALSFSSNMVDWVEIGRFRNTNGVIETTLPASVTGPHQNGFLRARIPDDALFVPGKVLVSFKRQPTLPEFTAMAEDGGLRQALDLTATEAMEDFGVPRLVTYSTDKNPVEAAEVMGRHPFVEIAQPVWLYSTGALPNDPRFAALDLWGVSDEVVIPQNLYGSKASAAWNNGFTNAGDIVVGVVDTGVDITHPDLAANIWVNPGEIPGNGQDDDGNGYVDDVNGYDFARNSASVRDNEGHGSHVAGTIGAVGNNGIGVVGVAPRVRILSSSFLGVPDQSSTENAVRALDYLTDLKKNHGVNIVAINNSWGFKGCQPPYDPAVHSASIRAAKAGILLVWSAGNSGCDNDQMTGPYARHGSLDTSVAPVCNGQTLACETPASYDANIAVAAIAKSGILASFSNYGLRTVDLGAPGVSILSTVPGGYSSYSGTSMAAPHVTGALALYAAYADEPPSLRRRRLLDTCLSTPSLAGKTVTGGRLNVAALLASRPADPNRPPQAADDLASATIGGAAVSIAVLANDQDPDGDAMVVASFTQPTQGGAVSRSPGNTNVLVFAATASAAGAVHFQYTVSDARGGTAVGVVRVNVAGLPNRPPVVIADQVTLNPGQPFAEVLVLANDSDPDGNALTVSQAGPATHGTVTVVNPAAGLVRYSPANPSNPTADTFQYTARDPGGLTASASVQVRVQVVAPPPPPALVSPANGAQGVAAGTPLAFVPHATAQETEIRLHRWPDHEVTTVTTTGSHVAIPAGFFVPGTQYDWRARSRRAGGVYGNSSETFSFSTVLTAAAPSLTQPAENAAVTDCLTALSWTSPPGAYSQVEIRYGYDTEVQPERMATLGTFHATSGSTLHTFDRNRQVRVVIRGRTSLVTGAWSPVRTFTTPVSFNQLSAYVDREAGICFDELAFPSFTEAVSARVNWSLSSSCAPGGLVVASARFSAGGQTLTAAPSIGSSSYWSFDPVFPSTFGPGSYTMNGTLLDSVGRALAHMPDRPFEVVAQASVATLGNGVPKREVVMRPGQYRLFKLAVPSLQQRVFISVQDEDALSDAEFFLYGKLGAVPTVENADWANLTPSPNEALQINNPDNGDYYVMVKDNNPLGSGIGGSCSATITMTYVPYTPDGLANSVETPEIADARTRGEKWYYIDVPAGQADLTVRTRQGSGAAGNMDLWVNPGSMPTAFAGFAHQSRNANSAEQIVITNPTAGRYFIMLRADTAPYDKVFLTALYRGANQLPTIAITSPPAGAKYLEHSDIDVRVSPADADGTINRTELFEGSALLATDTTAPYSLVFKDTAVAGIENKTLFALAYDDRGGGARSGDLPVSVYQDGFFHAALAPGQAFGPMYSINNANRNWGFRFDLDPNYRWDLRIETFGGDGDLTLKAERGEFSSTGDVDLYTSDTVGNNESIDRPAAFGGTWSVVISPKTDTYRAAYVRITATPRLAAPVLVSPVNGVTGARITPTLNWGPVLGATAYQMEIYRDSTDGAPARSYPNSTFPVLTATDLTIPDNNPLLNLRTYFWRVRAENATGTGNGVWSDFFSFTTR